jgi:predicted nucleotidyltransferase
VSAADQMAPPWEALQTLPILERCFGEGLLAAYLYGSAVAGGLRPDSDVDLMAVIDRPTAPEQRRQLAAELMRVSGPYPPKPGASRPIELIVFQRPDLSSLTYPARREFLYGEWLRRGIEGGAIPEPASSPDATLVLAQARRGSRTLLGPVASEVLPPISDADIRRAMGGALPQLLGDLMGDERNVVLTLARMWRTLTTGEFVSKDVAAAWAVLLLPAAEAVTMRLARDDYLGTERQDWRTRHLEVQRLASALSARVSALL